MKMIEEMTWDELVEYNASLILLGVLETGGKGLKSAVHTAMDATVRNYEAWRIKK